MIILATPISSGDLDPNAAAYNRVKCVQYSHTAHNSPDGTTDYTVRFV